MGAGSGFGLGRLAIALVAAGDLYVVDLARGAVAADFARTPPRPYAIVLGNRVFSNGPPSAELAERLETGRQLYRAGLARRIIVSGLVTELRRARRDGRLAQGHGGRPGRRGDRSRRLSHGGQHGGRRGDGVQSLLIVSQAYHLPRAIYLARHAGMSAVGVAAPDFPGRPRARRSSMFFREALARTETLLEVALRGVRGLPPDQIPRAPSG